MAVDPMQAAAKALAADHDIEFSAVKGTGPKGVVTVADVSACIRFKYELAAAFTQQQQPAPVAATRKRAPASPQASAKLSDQQANDALWALGIRAGLAPPKVDPYLLPPSFRPHDPNGYDLVTNADGTGTWVRRLTE